MLQNLMKSVTKMLGTALFAILLVSFALWGIPNFSRESARAPIATVGSTEISVERFTSILNQQRQFMSRQFQTNITTHRQTPLGRSSTAGDIADAVVFLADAPAITGVNLTVDGGQHLVPLPRDVMYLTGDPPK